MKTMKKVLAIVTTFAMVLTMMVATGLTAFAAEGDYTITISNASKGETYTAYKILDATIKEDTADAATSYTISTSSPWFKIVTGQESTVTVKTFTNRGVTFTQSASDASVYVLSVPEGTTLTEDGFAKPLAQDIKTALDAGTVTATAAGNVTPTADGAATITVAGAGYYFIDTTLGSLAALGTAKTVTVEEKNSIPVPDKTTAELSKNAQIGDVVDFTISFKDGKGTDSTVTLKDTMSDGLTLDKNSFVVTGPTGKDPAGHYTITYPDGVTFQIVFDAAYVKSLDTNDEVTIAYKATVNENATFEETETNTLSLVYSNQTSEDKTSTVNTYKFAVLKYDGSDAQKKPLAGAVFSLKDANGNVVKLIKKSDTSYRVANGNETGAVETFTTVESGNIVIDGVDKDVTYSLLEVDAPAGYNKLTAEESVTVLEDNSAIVEIENNAGAVLPGTGGIGTTIFYVLGSLLVVGCGIVLVSRKRMQNHK